MRTPFSSIRPASPPDPAGAYPPMAVAGALLVVLVLLLLHVAGWPLSPLTWYLARASGLTLYLLLWLATVTGFGLTTKAFDRVASRGLVFSLHTYAMRLGWALLALHMLSLAVDSFVSFTLRDLLIPFTAATREPWTGCGVIAAYLGVLIMISFPLRRLTGYRVWRAIHWLTPALFGLALAHGLGAGSDTGATWVAALYAITSGVVAGMCWYRLLLWSRHPTPPSRVTPPPLDRLGQLQPSDRPPGLTASGRMRN